eukprot:g2020.t1
MSLRKRSQANTKLTGDHFRASKRAKSTRSTELDWEAGDAALSNRNDIVEDSAVTAAKLIQEEKEKKESVAEKRKRLAKAYLEKLDAANEEDGPLDSEILRNKLQDDQLRAAGRLCRPMAENLLNAEFVIRRYRGHRLPATCVALSPDGKYAFTASKDGSIIRWSTENGKKLFTVSKKHVEARERRLAKESESEGQSIVEEVKKKHDPYHYSAVHALTVSPDGRYLVSGGKDRLIRVWNIRVRKQIKTEVSKTKNQLEEDNESGLDEEFSTVETLDDIEFVDGLTGHRDTVSALCFRESNAVATLFSGSHDRTVKLWSIDEMAYMETLFGHQAEINAISALRRERCITSGRDNTVRLWKIPEESQLVFRGKGGSHDCVAMIDEHHYVSATDCGHLCLWNNARKKPCHVIRFAHGEDTTAEEWASEGTPNWITSVAVLQDTDVVASGSRDGKVRFWKADLSGRGCLRPVATATVEGFVNGLAFSKDGRFLAAAVGCEHRLGRWWKNSSKEGKKPGLVIIETPQIQLHAKNVEKKEETKENGDHELESNSSSEEEEGNDGKDSFFL